MATTATNNWKLGLFVVVGVLTMVAALFWLGARRFQRTSFPAVSYFDESVQGLDVGSPVKFRGVTVGNVADITIAPDHRHVQVTSDVYVDALQRLGLGDHAAAKGRAVHQPPAPHAARLGGHHRGAVSADRLLSSAPLSRARCSRSSRRGTTSRRRPRRSKSVSDHGDRGGESSARPRRPHLRDAGDDEHDARLRSTVSRPACKTRTARSIACSCNCGRPRRTSARRSRQAKLAETTASIRTAAGNVSTAATGFGDLREDLQASLATLRETLDSVRAVADSLERDPSVLLRGPRADKPAPKVTK